MIKILNLKKKFGENQVLNGVTATLVEGNVYGIVGENGSGKTTLFRCLAGLENYKGEIEYDGGMLKNELGLLLTEPFFMTKITGLEYLKFMCQARSIDSGNLLERNVFDLPLNRYAETYSTGMKKKLALTAILMQENSVFILDEPFNGVDIQSNILISEIILKLKALNKTIILSSHIFSTLSDTCDQIFLLKKGEFSNPILKHEYAELEKSMKEETVLKRLDKLGLK
ncbi:MAG: ABC-2 type transport system ATP-binding protein [Salibacteraceae bacterium]|jgi:ABC-2 type transport system ATP-binding protein|tara:strand:+ start:365 stop:1045 length:681 start_codon:yes stop_codon:yes gene_type:complete